MAQRRYSGHDTRVPSTPGFLPDRPPISALFLIDFDVKAGYTIVWKRSDAGLDLEGAVEYKSLPSGLHSVKEDLIYFVHEDGYAGLSAFYNLPTDEEESRHARMIAVGVLVPLSYGRLGRAWRHAEALKDMAKKLASDRKQTHLLKDYWTENSKKEGTPTAGDSPLSSPSTPKAVRPKNHSRKRSASDGAAMVGPGHRLSPFHPAWSLNALLDTFGPLIFPIYRAALLRQRILISTHAPVHEACNFVYDISILANIPFSVLDVLDQNAPIQRLRPLFTIGVHDMPFLIEDSTASKRRASGETVGDEYGSGWVACTTDSILAMKEDLWDVLITMPPSYSGQAKEKVWPTVETSRGVPLKATQRDYRRFRTLRLGLDRLATATAQAPESAENTSTPTTPRPRPSTSSGRSFFLDDDHLADAAENIVEPSTWAALAYTGFMWWASAGEQRRNEETEESSSDASLLADLGPPMMPSHRGAGFNASLGSDPIGDSVSSLTARRAPTFGDGAGAGRDDGDERARVELAIIAYFHRYTSAMLGVLADIVESNDDYRDEDSDGESPEEALLDDDEHSGNRGDGDGVRVDSDALFRMGLDIWSQADVEFVRELTARYFDRKAYVEGKGVEVCGLRVC